MKWRVLPVEEWPRLDETMADVPWKDLDRDQNIVLVVEDGDQIVGRCVLMRATHGEFAWIAPTHRKKTAVARTLIKAVMSQSRKLGPTLLMSACSDEMRSIVPRLGAKALPGAHFVLNLAEVSCRQP